MKSEKLEKNDKDNQPTPKRKGRPRVSKSKHYIDDVRFKELIIEYYKTDHFSEELGELINTLSEHIAFMPGFINYTYHDSMKSDSNYKIVKALNERKFDPSKGSPFAYFTTVCSRAFVHVIKKEDRKHQTIRDYQNELYDELFLQGFSADSSNEDTSNDY